MKVRVVYKPDKSVSIIYPAPKSRRDNETEEQWLGRVFDKTMKCSFKGLEFDDIDETTLPQTREDRDAWEGEKGKGISINRAKARRIKKIKETEEKIRMKLREIAIRELKREG